MNAAVALFIVLSVLAMPAAVLFYIFPATRHWSKWTALGGCAVFAACIAVAASAPSHAPATLTTAATAPTAMPSYCGSKATEKLPECGWTAEKDASISKPRPEPRKFNQAEVEEMARLYTICMKTDTPKDTCARKAGVDPALFR